MTEAIKKYYTREEYLALEENARHKSEYFQGQIFMMAGGTPKHNQIAANVITALNNALADKPCIIYTSDMRILVKANGLYTYADVTVICGEEEFAPGRDDTITNPIMLVEVLSKSSRNYDRGDKFALYRDLPSLQIYLVVDQFKIDVECYQKLEDGTWKLNTYNDLAQVIKLEALEIELDVGSFYRKVVFPSKAPKRIKERIVPHPSSGE